ncbi:MAG: APC family permease [Chloroflexi bacterium]|nr:APC family permease [Chloroflexota bacterium]
MAGDGRPGDEVGGEQILHALGYKQELNRAVSVLGTIALVVSDITPTASLLVIGPVVIATAGSGSLWAYIIGCFIAINVALCMGELGSMFPVAGGLYSIVTRVLGRPVGFLALLDYIGQAIFLPASVAIGIGVYVQALNPGIPSNIAATVVMIAVTVIAILRINFNAVLTGVFLLIELVVVTVLALAGFSHWQQPLTILTNPVMGDGSAVGLPLIFTAVAIAMFSVNGYDSAINFSEETKGSASHVGQAVVRAAMIGIVFELIPFIAIVFGAPDLGKFIGSPTPLTDVARSAFGDTFVNFLTYGAIIAIFNASLAITLQFARIVWSSGRDRAWPGPISDAIAQVHPTLRTPWVATILTGGMAAILCFQSSLVTVVTFTAVLLIVLYALIALSALVSRMRQASLPRPYRMPFWPVPPLIALVGTIVAITQQKTTDLLIVGVIAIVGIVYFFLFLEPNKDRYWNMSTDTSSELSRLP